MSGSDKNTGNQGYIFGPVPSRRLGLSLGVDIIPFKVCPLDCVYCQVGHTTDKTVERKEYVAVDKVLVDLKSHLDKNIKANYITISGSGEPTLHSKLGELIEKIKTMTDIPVAVLTNGVLFYNESVRRDCCKADLVLPSLDAAGQEEFEKINRPCSGISIKNIIEGLKKFREEYKGQIWLEVFIIEGINTAAEHISRIRSAIQKIKPDKVQLNSVARPTADNNIKKVDSKIILEIANQLGDNCEIITPGNWGVKGPSIERNQRDILDMLKRRPCSLNDICNGLGMVRNEAIKCIENLLIKGKIEVRDVEGEIFYKSI